MLGLFVLGTLLLIEWRPWRNETEHALQPAPVSQTAPTSQMAPTPQTALVSQSESRAIPSPAERVNPKRQAIRAQLSPVTYTTIAAELSARVYGIPFREGESFKKGQVIVTFDCKEQQAKLDRAGASLSVADLNYQTNGKLLALNSVGQVEYQNSFFEYQKAKAERDELVALVDHCVIYAPFNGRVAEQRIRAQQYAQAGQALLDILDSAALELEFVTPSQWSAWLTVGYKFQIRVEETGRSYPARVTRVAAKIDPVSQTIKVAAVVVGSYSELSPGMSGVVEIMPPKAGGPAIGTPP